ncbi:MULTISPECIES: hypothetical protein [Cupriavidus]
MHSRGNNRVWAQAVLDGKMNEQEPKRPTKAFRKPLTAAELRAMLKSNPSPEVHALLWEVARLRAHVRRGSQLYSCVVQNDPITRRLLPHIIDAMERELKGEPCLLQDEPGGMPVELDDFFNACW